MPRAMPPFRDLFSSGAAVGSFLIIQPGVQVNFGRCHHGVGFMNSIPPI